MIVRTRSKTSAHDTKDPMILLGAMQFFISPVNYGGRGWGSQQQDEELGGPAAGRGIGGPSSRTRGLGSQDEGGWGPSSRTRGWGSQQQDKGG